MNPGKSIYETGAQYRARMAAEAEAGGTGAQTEAVTVHAGDVITIGDPSLPKLVKDKQAKRPIVAKPKKK